MTLKQLEIEVKELKAETERLREKVKENARANDHIGIWKLMSMYSHYYYLGYFAKVPELFAQNTPGVTMEIEDSGVYEGVEGVTRFWTEVFDENRNFRTPGWLAVHMTVNPIIEINSNGTRASGIWHSHGLVSSVKDDRYKQNLCMGKYIVDYVKESVQWKFHHFNYRIAFMCSLTKGWVEEPMVASIAGIPGNRPDKPTTYHMPYSRYRINSFEPGPPEPFND